MVGCTVRGDPGYMLPAMWAHFLKLSTYMHNTINTDSGKPADGSNGPERKFINSIESASKSFLLWKMQMQRGAGKFFLCE
jgi:hypothetical protein